MSGRMSRGYGHGVALARLERQRAHDDRVADLKGEVALHSRLKGRAHWEMAEVRPPPPSTQPWPNSDDMPRALRHDPDAWESAPRKLFGSDGLAARQSRALAQEQTSSTPHGGAILSTARSQDDPRCPISECSMDEKQPSPHNLSPSKLLAAWYSDAVAAQHAPEQPGPNTILSPPRAGGLIVDAGSKKAASLASVLRERADQVEARLAARLAERQALAAAQQEAREQAKRLAAEEAACKVAAVEAKQALARELQDQVKEGELRRWAARLDSPA
ncbi:hypothetical protein ACKKBG_A07930 [Auxenochlorella protothecoides x Auxenochlorella symbiontica]